MSCLVRNFLKNQVGRRNKVLTLTFGGTVSVRSWGDPGTSSHICAAIMTLQGYNHSFVWQALFILPRASCLSKTAVESIIAQILPVALWENGWPYSFIWQDSWRISSEVGGVWVEKKQNQLLGTTRQQESFQHYPGVAQLRDPSRFVLGQTFRENGQTICKVSRGAYENFGRRRKLKVGIVLGKSGILRSH